MFLGFMNLLELCAKFGMNAHVHYFSFFPFFFFCFLGPHSWHMEVPKLGAQSEL